MKGYPFALEWSFSNCDDIICVWFFFFFFLEYRFVDRFLNSLLQIDRFSYVKLRSDDASSSIRVDNEIMIQKDEIYFYW